MGAGTYNVKKYYQVAAGYQSENRDNLFKQGLYAEFNPLTIKKRESCASKEHPNPTSIIISCDVTGSMGAIPESLLKGGLGKVMDSLLNIKAISNPQVMFAAIGDTQSDIAPLQVTQFESDNRIEAQLKNLYLEGNGGGNNVESYHAIWYFAWQKTQLDVWKQGKKGILFTMGDEMVPSTLKAADIIKFIDSGYTGPDIETSELIKQVTEKYDVFHLIVQETQTYRNITAEKVNACWKKYLGERAILVSKFTDIPEKIISTVKTLCEIDPQLSKSSSSKAEYEEVKIANAPSSLFRPLTAVPSAPKAGLNKDVDGIPLRFICPIYQDTMTDPVMAEDGHNYERKAITDWLGKKSTSPTTNDEMGNKLIQNNDLRSEIQEWLTNNSSAKVKCM